MYIYIYICIYIYNEGMYYSLLKINVSSNIPACHKLFIYSFISQEKDKEKVPKI